MAGVCPVVVRLVCVMFNVQLLVSHVPIQVLAGALWLVMFQVFVVVFQFRTHFSCAAALLVLKLLFGVFGTVPISLAYR